MVSLYEPEAVFISAPGQVTAGSESVREVFAGSLAAKPRFGLKIRSLHQVGNIALESLEWKLQDADPDGNPMAPRGTGSAVLHPASRRTIDYVIDNPFLFE